MTDAEARIVKAIWRQANRYDYASRQDRSVLVAARHNGYAVALIDSLRDNFTEDQVKKVTGESLKEKRASILAQQDVLDKLFMAMETQLKSSNIPLPENPSTLDSVF
jgi:hypothetical protein